MKTRILSLSLLLVLFVSNAIGQETPIQIQIDGKLIDATTSEPVVGAKVSTKGKKAVVISGTDGSFNILADTDYPITLTISANGFTDLVYQVDRKSETALVLKLDKQVTLNEIVVSGRRRKEVAQDIPIPITVVSGQKAEDAGAFNVNRLKELIPSVQLYSSNARNTTLNIRGLGSTFGLTNDGIDPGVGFYIDGVYHARPAVTALDFVDVEQIEVLRGPQGSLFGKNTTAGAFNITTKKPTETPTAKVELSYGNYNYFQAKTSLSGKLAKNLLTRISFSGTQRQGTIFNVNDEQHYNGLNNLGLKSQLYYTPTKKLSLQLIGDYNNQRPDGSALVVAGVTKTLRSDYRQYDNIVRDLGYNPTVIDPFSRKIYTNTPYRHDQSIGGVSLNVDYKIGKGTLTSTTAWRFWNWDPINDRDFTEIAALTKSQAPSRHDQYSQEIRYAGNIIKKLDGVIGVYYLNQTLKTDKDHEEEVGKDQWRFVQTSNSGNQALYSTPGLLDNYGIRTNSKLNTTSSAIFGQLDYDVFKNIHVIGGLRYNYDEKIINYDRQTYGGLETTDAKLIALKKAVYTNQSFNAKTKNTNLSGNLTIAYKPTSRLNAFATFSTAYKPVGVNLGGLPTLPSGEPDLETAIIKPEYVEHTELGIKTKLFKGATLNVSAYNTDIKDYQTNVQSPQLGVNRGYLANAEKVNVKGLEVDAAYQLKNFLSLNASVAYTDGRYVKFTNAPLPLEETGKTIKDEKGATVQQAFKDVSGGVLPGISNWNFSGGFDVSTTGNLLGKTGRFFIASDVSSRSKYSSNPSPSEVLVIKGYTLLNARFGFRSNQYSVYLWSRNLGNSNYFEQLQAAAGNSGLYAGVLGDPRTYGVTFKYSF